MVTQQNLNLKFSKVEAPDYATVVHTNSDQMESDMQEVYKNMTNTKFSICYLDMEWFYRPIEVIVAIYKLEYTIKII